MRGVINNRAMFLPRLMLTPPLGFIRMTPLLYSVCLSTGFTFAFAHLP